MALGKLRVPGHPTIRITLGQGPTALAVGAGGVCLDIFTLIYPFFPLSPSLRETARYSCCCIIVLRPRLTSKVMSGRSFNLITLFLGRLRPPKRLTSTSCTYFCQ